MKIDQVIVFAHGGAQNNFNRMYPYWERHDAPIMVRAPVNDPVRTDEPIILYGQSAWAGSEAINRTLAGLRYALTLGGDYFLFHEHDSLALTIDSIRPASGMQCIRTIRSVPQFGCSLMCNFPWTFDRESLAAVVAMAEKYPDITEGGFTDTWMGMLASLCKFPVRSYVPPGFCVDHIRASNIHKLLDQIWDNCTVFHGVKKQWELDFILDERERYLNGGGSLSFIPRVKPA